MKNVSSRQRARSAGLLVIAVCAFFIAGMGWVFASPVGGSPDEDYHLGSVWCPRPAEQTCNTIGTGEDEKVEVPAKVMLEVKCHAFNGKDSAVCGQPYDENEKVFSSRFDTGGYPKGYYHFHHLFVGQSVDTTVMVIRAVNLAIAVVLFSFIGVFLKKEQRHPYVLAMFVSWLPMGWYLIVSVNPSSWAIIGVFAYAAGLYGSITNETWRRWPLLGASVVGAILSCTARGDSAFYIFVVSIAFAFLFKWNKKIRVQGITAIVMSLIGIMIMANTGQGETFARSENYAMNPVVAGIRALYDVPRFFAGFTGMNYGLGWVDTNLDGPALYLAIFVLCGIVMLGLRSGTWRKWMAVLMLVGAMAGIPVLMVAKGAFEALWGYHPRYQLPLLAVLIFVLLVSERVKPIRLSLMQTIFASFSFIIIHVTALHRTLWRYVAGVDGSEPVNLDKNIEWWWNGLSISPMEVWRVSSVAFVIAILVTMWLVRETPDTEVAIAEQSEDAELSQ